MNNVKCQTIHYTQKSCDKNGKERDEDEWEAEKTEMEEGKKMEVKINSCFLESICSYSLIC